MMPSRYDNELKIDFALFPNDNRATDKHPIKNGKIEFTKPFLKQMLERAKSGTMPVLNVAIWNRTAKTTGKEYENVRLTMHQPAVQEDDGDDGEFPF
jgi:hypothetical protein|tara:strand:+ start:1002 stop:1292 length:291 start_codon:yes stop_codon:yes gene_type:complete